MGWTGYRVVFDLRRDLIDKLLKLPTPYYDTHAAGVIQSKISFDAHQLASAASGAITNAIRSTLTIAVSFGYLMWLNWRLTLLTFIVVPIVGIVIRYFSRRLRRIARDIQDRSGSMTQVLEELIGGHRVVRVFGGEEYERDRAVAAANRLRNAMTKESSATAASSPLTVFFAACAVGSIVWIALQQSRRRPLRLRAVHVLRRRAAHAARAAEGPVRHQRVDPARAGRRREHLRPARPRGGGRHRHRRARALQRRSALRAHVAALLRERPRGAVRHHADDRARARRSRSSAHPAAARRRSSTSSRASTSRPRDASSSTATT